MEKFLVKKGINIEILKMIISQNEKSFRNYFQKRCVKSFFWKSFFCKKSSMLFRKFSCKNEKLFL